MIASPNKLPAAGDMEAACLLPRRVFSQRLAGDFLNTPRAHDNLPGGYAEGEGVPLDHTLSDKSNRASPANSFVSIHSASTNAEGQ